MTVRSTKDLKFNPLNATLHPLNGSGRHEVNQVRFQVEQGSVAIAWNLFGQISRIDLWLDSSQTVSAAQAAICAGSLSSAPLAVSHVAEGLREYFRNGTPLQGVSSEWIDRSAWTPFQMQVYQAISMIPHGETRTYGWVAGKVGRNGLATRAVGQALRKNPLPILVPCHRVVATNSLGGFMGKMGDADPEVQLKVKLLSIETEYLNPIFPFLHSDGSGFQTSHASSMTGTTGGWSLLQ